MSAAFFSQKGKREGSGLCRIRTAYFFGGVIFCGEELWEKGGGSVFLFSSASSLFNLSVSFPFCLYFLLCLLVWLALFDLACMACIA